MNFDKNIKNITQSVLSTRLLRTKQVAEKMDIEKDNVHNFFSNWFEKENHYVNFTANGITLMFSLLQCLT